jgi:hypothetical protein
VDFSQTQRPNECVNKEIGGTSIGEDSGVDGIGDGSSEGAA